MQSILFCHKATVKVQNANAALTPATRKKVYSWEKEKSKGNGEEIEQARSASVLAKTSFLVFYNTAVWAFTYVGQISFQLWTERAWRDQIGQDVRAWLSPSHKTQAWIAAGPIPSRCVSLETLIICVVWDLTSYCRIDLDK